MSELTWLVPVYRRPQRVAPLLETIAATTPQARVLFLADPEDQAECAAIRRARRSSSVQVDAIACGGGYAEKINQGARQAKSPLLFLGADDLEPLDGWFEAAIAHMADDVEVVGINDLIDRPGRPQHATHFLVTRPYALQPTADGGRGPLHEGYKHWGCDDELIGTASKRGAYVYGEDVLVRHLHPMMGLAPDDDVYRKGRSHARHDLRLLRRRSRLWS